MLRKRITRVMELEILIGRLEQELEEECGRVNKLEREAAELRKEHERSSDRCTCDGFIGNGETK